MITAMLTTSRSVNYYEATIRSLDSTGFFESGMGPLHVFFGGPRAGHMQSLEGDLRFAFHYLGDEFEKLWRNLGTKPRCALGHYSLMKGLLELEGWDEALVIEDDVAFARGWQKYLRVVLDEIRSAYDDRWMTSLYCLRTGVREKYNQRVRWYDTPGELFWGLQGVVYPKTVMAELVNWVFENSVKASTDTIDGSIGKCGAAKGIHTVVIVPSLVQHMGHMTTGQSNYFHRANLFLDPVIDPALGEPWQKS